MACGSPERTATLLQPSAGVQGKNRFCCRHREVQPIQACPLQKGHRNVAGAEQARSNSARLARTQNMRASASAIQRHTARLEPEGYKTFIGSAACTPVADYAAQRLIHPTPAAAVTSQGVISAAHCAMTDASLAHAQGAESRIRSKLRKHDGRTPNFTRPCACDFRLRVYRRSQRLMTSRKRGVALSSMRRLVKSNRLRSAN